MSKAYELLILGTTGGSGIECLKQALERGWNVTTYDRSPEKLPEELRKHPNATILKGQLPDAPATLEPYMDKLNFVICMLGPNSFSGSGDAIPNLYAWLFPRLKKIPKETRPYLLGMGTQSILAPEDGFDLFTEIHRFVIGTIARGARYEIMGIRDAFMEEMPEDKRIVTGADDELDCMMFRLNLLKDGENRDSARAGFVGQFGWKANVDRAALAKWLLDECTELKWNRQMPAIWSHTGWM